MPKLSDSQLVILNAACKRPNCSIYPVTSKLSGGALAKVLSSLLAKGLVKETRAKQGETHWRLDDERPLTLVATPAAFEVLGIGEGKDKVGKNPKRSAGAASKPKRLAKAARAKKGKPGTTRADSKQAHREADVLADVTFLVEDRRAEPIEAEPAAAFPADSLRYAALLALDDIVQTRRAMRNGVLAHLDADIAATHFVRDGGGGAGAEKGIEHEVASGAPNC